MCQSFYRMRDRPCSVLKMGNYNAMGNLLSSPSLVYIPAFANIVSIRTYPVVPTELSSGQQYVGDNFPVSDCLLNSRISIPMCQWLDEVWRRIHQRQLEN